ncbi:hypothetical protein D9615_003449 [Tricholomella constricta]|uniref:Uncharacterized protein n=1 Tax=Tricholomella constricta TaxID=117010 RepID=A0A8H5HJ26_9AGAR|nr:hypothetical protein D9615_003449 [Tricholomella constricta]
MLCLSRYFGWDIVLQANGVNSMRGVIERHKRPEIALVLLSPSSPDQIGPLPFRPNFVQPA